MPSASPFPHRLSAARLSSPPLLGLQVGFDRRGGTVVATLFPAARVRHNHLRTRSSSISTQRGPNECQMLIDFHPSVNSASPPLPPPHAFPPLPRYSLDNHRFLLEGYLQWKGNL